MNKPGHKHSQPVAGDHKPGGSLIAPYGGTLIDLMVPDAEKSELKEHALSLETLTLTTRQLCDLELLAVGAFSPLDTFMNQTDYESVLQRMRLADGTLFPMPVTLPVHKRYTPGQQLALRDTYGNILAVLRVEEVYPWDLEAYAATMYGDGAEDHPLMPEMRSWGSFNISGPLAVIALPEHKDFVDVRRTPAEIRRRLQQIGNNNVVAFQTRNPLHRAHEELTKRAMKRANGTLLLHPSVGMTKPGDVDAITRVRCYKALIDNHYPKSQTVLSVLPLAMRMAGPREALWHAIIRRNYGANHFIVGRDHAGPGNDSQGKPFFEPYAAQKLVKAHAAELGIDILAFQEMRYLPSEDRYVETGETPETVETVSISGTQVREEYLAKGVLLPEWFTRPSVAAILAEAYPPTHRQGFCVWFTGLSGSGKTTLAQALEATLLMHGRRVSMLDGDVVRHNLSKGLGFSKEDRETNITRVGYVASHVVAHRGIVICALISPYETAREQVRALFDKGNFIEVYLSTPFDICQARDPKGHYTQAKHGKLKHFTGVDDSYEPPQHPDVTIDTSKTSVDRGLQIILNELTRRGLLAAY